MSEHSSPISPRHDVPLFADAKIRELAAKMMTPGLGVDVQDRKWKGKTYEQCFIASDAVSWLAKEANIPRGEAIELGVKLQRLGLFSHCLFEHQFKDEMLYFRFTGTQAVADDKNRPPGSFGVPVVGETLLLQSDVPGFFESRAQKYQGFFKSNLLFNKCVVFSDPESMSIFYDDTIIQRENSMPPHWVEMFSGGNPANATVNMIDGDKHRQRKAALMSCFSHAAVAAYLPLLETVCGGHLKKWVVDAADQMKWVPALKSMCFEECCRFILGVDPSPELVKSFDDIMAAFAALPIKLPGSTLSTGLSSRDKILDLIRKGISQNKTTPAATKSAVAFLLDQATTDTSLTDDIISFETLQFMIAGMAPVYTLHVYLLLELSQNPAAKDKVREEVNAAVPSGPLTLESLEKLPYCSNVIKEVQRLHAGNAVPFSWGKISKDFSHVGFDVPAGWGGLGGFHGCSQSAKVFDTPEKFDPTRFMQPREEHKKHRCAFVPQGLVENVEKTHGCAGYFMTEVMLKVFLVHLMRSFDWELSAKQKLAKDAAAVPALPAGGLKVKIFQAQKP